MASILMCVLGLAFESSLSSLSQLMSSYVPSIEKLHSGHPSERFAAGYFSLMLLFIPPMVGYLLWGEHPLGRFRYTAAANGRGIGNVIGVIALGVPLLLALFFLLYAAPIEMPATPHLSGQHVLALTLGSFIGVLVFGPLLILGVVIYLVIVLFLIALPFLTVIDHLGGKKVPSSRFR